MARIIVRTERSSGEVVLDERVGPEHLSTEHSAAQLIERLRWAVHDAETAHADGDATREAARDPAADRGQWA